MVLRTKLVIATSLPAALALACYYLSAVTDGPDSLFLFRSALLLTFAAAWGGRVTWLGHRVHQEARANEERAVALTSRLRDLERSHEDLRTEVQARLAVREWRRAVGARPIRLVDPRDN